MELEQEDCRVNRPSLSGHRAFSRDGPGLENSGCAFHVRHLKVPSPGGLPMCLHLSLCASGCMQLHLGNACSPFKTKCKPRDPSVFPLSSHDIQYTLFYYHIRNLSCILSLLTSPLNRTHLEGELLFCAHLESLLISNRVPRKSRWALHACYAC